MKALLSSTSHASLDYIYGGLLAGSPWIYGFNGIQGALWPPVITGLLSIVMGIFTNYEGGFIKIIPFKVHLAIDVLAGIALMASPWILGFADEVWVPHLLMGLIVLAVTLFTERNTFRGREYQYDKPYIYD